MKVRDRKKPYGLLLVSVLDIDKLFFLREPNVFKHFKSNLKS
jgi:hypothetical protein